MLGGGISTVLELYSVCTSPPIPQQNKVKDSLWTIARHLRFRACLKTVKQHPDASFDIGFERTAQTGSLRVNDRRELCLIVAIVTKGIRSGIRRCPRAYP